MSLYTDIGSKYKSVTRYNQIIKVLIKYGFDDLVQYLEEKKRFLWLQKIIPKASKIQALRYTKWEKMRLVCEELGPTFIKFGQILSNRPDLIPLKLTFELEKLLDNVPPMPEAVAKQMVEIELKDSVENLFAWFEPKPFASASMAQVHKVILKDGKRVALKIQRPGIKEIIEEDIKVMYSVAELLQKRIPSLKSFDPTGLVRNFEEAITKELDFINESINVQRFYNDIKEDRSADQYAVAPKVYPEYTTTKILALEFMSGTKIDNFNVLEEKGIDVKLIAQRLTKSYFKQIFNYGFFHADPHAGNLLVLPNSHICFLDFGMMGSILPRDIEVFGKLFLGITRKDIPKIIKALQRLSNYSNIDDIRALEFDINEFVEKYYVRSIHKNEMSTILLELKDIVIAHGLKVPTHFFLLAKSMVTLEGVAHKLNPELDEFAIAKPFLIRAIAKSFNPIKFGEKAINSVYELGNYMEEFPRDLKNAIRKINRGEMKVDLTHKGIDPIVHTVYRVTKQLVTAFIIAALIIGSSLFIVSDIGPLWNGFSVAGIVFIAIVIILSVGMIKDIRKGYRDEWWYKNK